MTNKQLLDLFGSFVQEEMQRRYSNVNASKRAEAEKILTHIRNFIQGQSIVDPGRITEYLNQSRGDKKQARAMILDFFQYYEKETDEKVHHDLNTIHPVDIPLLRQLEILKFLHTPATTKKISEHFGISEETARNDLNSLKDGIQLYDSLLKVEPETSGREQKKSYKSTVHPIFLTLNMTEIAALTTGLNHLTGQAGMEDLYLPIISKIYHQLSQYAKAKVDGIDAGLQAKLPDHSESYRNEERWVMETDNIRSKLFYAFKAGAFFDLCINTPTRFQYLKKCRLTAPPFGERITFEHEDETKELLITEISTIRIDEYI